jgi:hypothetical protein
LTLATGRVCVGLFTDIEIVQRAVLRQTLLNETCAKTGLVFLHNMRIGIEVRGVFFIIEVFTTSGHLWIPKKKEMY